MGCDVHQGFFFHKPMGPDHVESLLLPARVDSPTLAGLVLA
jgi:EAL domain-containing protein (putative c-di-GMP-specific phosphodiesterase class I)